MSSMTLKDLALVGAALFGPRWRSDVARELGVQYRTIARWYADGRLPDADGVRDKLRVVVRRRLEGVEDARRVLWRRADG